MSRNAENTTGPDLALIKKFAKPWDRRYPPVFVGREEEIEIVEENCRAAFDHCRKGKHTAGHIVLFRGAPGAGKSSLLEHVAERWSGKPDCPQTLDIELDTLEDPAAVALEIVKKIAPGKEEMFRSRLVTNTAVSGGVPGLVTGEVTTSSETSPEKISFSVLKELLPPQDWRQPLCILADEIQNVTEKHRQSLLTLHQGKHGLPIVLVGAGLADSAEKLQQAMSPRLTGGNLRTLGALPCEEVHSCVRQMFDMCRIAYSSGQLEPIAGRIAKDSEGWPQHVRTETAALFGGLDATQGDLGLVDDVAVVGAAAEYRKNSYRMRRSKVIGDSILLVGALLQETPLDGLHKLEVRRNIRNKAETNKEGWDLPAGMNATDFLDHLIHQGIFQPDEDDMLSCPIPSLQTWLIERAAIANQQSALPAPPASPAENRGALEAAVEQSRSDRNRRAEPDREHGAGR